MLNNLFFPIDEGNNNEKKFINYIENFCINNKLEYKKVKIEVEKEFTSNSYNIEIFIKGSEDFDNTLVFIVSLDSPIIKQSYYDNSISLQLMFDLILRFKNSNLNKNLLCIFSGANNNENKNYLGIKKFIKNREDFNKIFITYFDILSYDSKIKFRGSVNKKPINAKILTEFFKLKNFNKDIYYDSINIEKAKFNLLDFDEIYSYLINNNFNAVTFSNTQQLSDNVFYYDSELYNRLLIFFYNWILSLDKLSFPLEQNYNYFVFDKFGKIIIIKEYYLIIFYLIIFFVIFFVRQFFPQFQRIRVNMILKIAPYFIFLYLIYFLLSFIPFLIYHPFEKLFNLKKPYLNIPILYLIFVFIISFLIILIMNKFLRKLPIPKHNYLYLIGAIISSYINIIILLYIDISQIYIYLSVLIILTISTFTGKNYFLKFILYFICFLPFFNLIYNLTMFTDVTVIKNLFSNIVLQNFLFTYFSFPFILLLLRVTLILEKIFNFYLNNILILFLLIIIISFSLFIFSILTISIFPEKEIIKSKIITNIDKKQSYIEIKSNQKIGELLIIDNEKKEQIFIKEDYYKTKCSFINPPYNFKIKKINFGYYDKIEFNLKTNTNIEYLNLYIIMPEDLYPFETNYEFIKYNDNFNQFDTDKFDIYKFIIPRNIIESFNLELSLFKNNNYKLYLEFIYNNNINNNIDIVKTNQYVYRYYYFLQNIKL